MTFDPSEYPGGNVPSPAQASPGWYPVDHLSQRYWDGYEWTAHVAPLNPSAGVRTVATADDKSYALIMHLGGLFVGFLVPLIMWLIKKDESTFIDHHGRQLMNWHISLFIYFIVSFILLIVLIGFFLILALIVMHFVVSIMGAIAANKGEYYTYPLTIPIFS